MKVGDKVLQTGTFLGNRYEIISMVGSGGMADVYKAKCHRLNRYVAIKILKEEFGKDADFVKRFHAEAQAAAGLLHPNIVNIYDVGEEKGLHYIVMELAEGVTLKEYIKMNGKLLADEVVNLSIQIAQGIEAAHNNRTVHRDIKPQNIIITNDGRVKVTDFGIARASNVNTITTATIGSVHYFSPEQARGGYVDARSDIYSLGITMYEMVTGHVPFDGENAVTVALMHLQDDVSFTESEANGIPKSLENIILKAVNKKPEFRYDTITDMIKDLMMVFQNPDGSYVSSPKAAMAAGATVIMPKADVDKIKAAHYKKEEKRIVKEQEEEEIEDNGLFKNTEDMNPKLEKIIMGLAVLVGIIFAAIFIGFIAQKIGNFGSGIVVEKETTTEAVSQTTTGNIVETEVVPQVTGKLKDDAVEELENLGFVVVVETEVSNDVEKDYVIRQSVPRGNEAEKGSTITLVVSEGKETIKIPNVVGNKENKGKKKMTDAGFQISTEEDYSSEYKEGVIMHQSPEAGTEAAHGTKVVLTISKGPKKVAVPSVIGRSKEAGRSVLEDAGLRLGNIDSAYSDSYEVGTIISQDPVKDTMVKEGTKVNVVISLGSASKNVSYEGEISLDCPFAEGVDSGKVTLILVQGENTKTIYERATARTEFPLKVEFTGYVEGNAVVTMYVDGNEYDSFSVYVEKVEN